MWRVIECSRTPRRAAALCVGHHTFDDLPRLGNAPGRVDHRLLEFGEHRRAVIGRAAEHHAVESGRQVIRNGGYDQADRR